MIMMTIKRLIFILNILLYYLLYLAIAADILFHCNKLMLKIYVLFQVFSIYLKWTSLAEFLLFMLLSSDNSSELEVGQCQTIELPISE